MEMHCIPRGIYEIKSSDISNDVNRLVARTRIQQNSDVAVTP